MSVTDSFRQCVTKSGYDREKNESQSKQVSQFESDARDWHCKGQSESELQRTKSELGTGNE